MIYEGFHPKVGQKVWACAYEFDTNKMSMKLKQEPVFGRICGYYWDSKDKEEEFTAYYFVPFSKNSKTKLQKSKCVRLSSRCYADTYRECLDKYNELVKERISWFQKRIEETRKDLIEEK